MKRILLSIAILLMTMVVCGQESLNIEEISVTAPCFTNSRPMTITSESQTDLLNQHLLDYFEANADQKTYQSGKVIVDFTVLPDGTLTNYMIRNSVSGTNDEAVINALQETSGYWSPGKNNGVAVAMDKRVVVAFAHSNRLSFVDVAQRFYSKAIDKYEYADVILTTNNFKEAKKQRVSARKLNASLRNLKKATIYRPFEPAVCFLELKIYQKQDNTMMFHQKMHEFELLTDATGKTNIEYIAIRF